MNGSGEEASPRSEYEKSEYITLTGTIRDIQYKSKITAVFLKDTEVMAYVRQEQQKQQLKIGNTVRIRGKTEEFLPARNPGNFDQRAYYQKQGIHALMWVEKAEILSADTDRFSQFLSEIRQKWKELLVRGMGKYYGGTMSAVLLGEKNGLDPEMKTLYQKNGIGHILAISGLHMSFIGAGIYSALRKIGAGFVPAGIAGGIILLCYTCMVGAGISSLRALLMFLIRIGADMSGRDYDMPTSLSLSAAVLVWKQPLWAADAGFQLSFGAVTGMFLLGPVFSETFAVPAPKKKGRKKLVRTAEKVSAGISAGLSVTIFLMGPVLYFYFELPVYSVFLNMLVIPLMPLVMGAGIAGSVFVCIWEPAGRAVWGICRLVLWIYDQICQMALAIPGSRFVTGRPPVWWVIIYYVGLALFLVFFLMIREKRQDTEGHNRKRNAALFLTGTGILLFSSVMTAACRMSQNASGKISVTVLDVGQGDCICIRSSRAAVLVDGGSSDVENAGKYRIEPFLLSEGQADLDYVFVSHGDSDHTNGILELLKNQKYGVRIRTLVLPPEEYHDENLKELVYAAGENETRIAVIREGDKIAPGGFTLTCLGPEEGGGTEPGNESSVVLELECGKFRMLLTGDLEGMGEENLVRSGKLKQYEVIKAAHHGSQNSGMEEFLNITAPEAAVISCGKDNKYGHPHKETLRRLNHAGCRIYNTAMGGAVTIVTDGNKICIGSFLEETLVKR